MSRNSLPFSRKCALAVASVALSGALPPVASLADDSLFCSVDAAVFANELVEVSGGGYIHSGDGDVGTLVQSNRKVVLSGGSGIDGDVVSSGEVKLSGGSHVTGEITEDATGLATPDPADELVETHRFDNDNHLVPLTGEGEVALDDTELEVSGGDSLVLEGGDYYFSEVKFSGGSTLVVTGDVRIFMPDGKFDMSGGGLAATEEFATLTVVMAGSGEVKTSGGSNFHGAIYAPNAKAEVSGDGNSYGSVVAKRFKLTGGSELHPSDVCVEGPPPIVVWWGYPG